MVTYFQFAADHGFRRLDLGCSVPANFPQAFTDQRIQRIKNLGQQYGISYRLHTASYVNVAEIMPTVRTAAEEHLLEYIRLSKRLDTEYCVIHCGYHFSLFQDTVMTSLIQTLTAAVGLVEKLQLPLVIENMNRVHPDCEIVYLGVPIEELTRIFTAISSPSLGLALDVGHAHLLPGGVTPWINAFPEKIYHLHLHDNEGVLDQHLPIGRGTIEYQDVFTQLRQIGFTGTGTLEVSFTDAVLESFHQLAALVDS